MDRRLELQSLLESILGSRNVYYQPPESIEIHFPAIIYSRNRIESTKADDRKYNSKTSYQVMVVDKNPDSEIVYKINELPLCRHDRHYVSENINHDVFTLYF